MFLKKDSEQVKADLQNMEISGLEEIGGLEKDETDEEEYRNKNETGRGGEKQSESSIKTMSCPVIFIH